MSRELTAAELQALEILVDACDLDEVLFALADVCDIKAEHIRASYSDEPLACTWTRREGQLRRLGTIIANNR